MISVYNLKPKFQQLLRPVLDVLHDMRISANQITMASIGLSFIIGAFFWFADANRFYFLALPLGLLIRMGLNALDGMMARIYKQQSKKGEVLNEIGDIISDVAIFFPLLKFESQSIYIVAIFICLSIINEFAGVMAKVVCSERRYDGPMGKSDRALLIAIYGLLGFAWAGFFDYSAYVFYLAIPLLIISTYMRLSKAL